MFDLLPQIIIIASISGIIVIIARKLPLLSSIPKDAKISDISGKADFIKTPGFLNKLLLTIKGFKYSEHFHRFLDLSERFLRKLKIVFLKLENKITDWAEFLRQQSQKVRIRREGIGIEIKNGGDDCPEVLRLDKKSGSGASAQEEREIDLIEEKYIAEITKNPRDIEIYRMLGELYIKKNNISDAREAFRQILRLNPSDKDAGLKLMKLRVRKKV